MTESRSLENDVQRLLDLEAIRDLPRRYCHHIWQRDAEGVASLYAEDAELPARPGRPLTRGREEILKFFQGVVSQPTGPYPFIHNHVIQLQGDRATGTCYLDLRSFQDGRATLGAGYYNDEYVKVGGEWKFRSRRIHQILRGSLTEAWEENRPS